MPRRKAATTTASTPITAPAKSHKRQLSSSNTTPKPTTTTTTATPASRQSKRIKASTKSTPTTTNGSKSTRKKSKYFDGSDSDDDENENPQVKGEDDEVSGYEDEDASASHASSATPSSAPVSSSEEEAASDSDAAPKKRGWKKKPQQARKAESGTVGAVGGIIEKGKELWRQGVKAGLGPGNAVYIEKPKPRGDGGVKYVPGEVHPNTMAFLGDLKANNEREWLKLHDADYRTSWKDWESFVEALTEKVVEKDDTIPELPPKDLVFRIYRDVRFSSDPTPYKPHFSAAWSRTGRKGPYAGYYLQIAPGKSWIGCGLWMPEAAPLALIRADVDRNPEAIRCVLMEPAIRKEILGGIPSDEKKAVKAFVSQNGENALKTKPKGYEADNPNIDFLRLKNFTIGRKLKDEEIVGPGCLDMVASLVGTMAPFVRYLNSVIMPDEGHEGSSDEGGTSSAEEAGQD